MVGTRGPIPKRSESRQRRNEPEREVTTAVGAEDVTVPVPDPEWHPIARRVWDSLEASGQSRFYEPSDWAVAFSLMDDLSYYKRGSKRSGQMLQTIMSSLSSLMVTEGDRRRLSLELNRPNGEGSEDDGKVAVMDKWRQRLG